jgi:HEAT repeat protein
MRELQAVQPLIEVLASPVWESLKCSAALALGAIGDPAAVHFLQRAVIDGDLMVFRAAVEALERFGDRELCAPDWLR